MRRAAPRCAAPRRGLGAYSRVRPPAAQHAPALAASPPPPRCFQNCPVQCQILKNSHSNSNWVQTAGIRALAEDKELLGSELRDIFDAHLPKALSKDERAALLERGPTGGMARFTGGDRAAPWPYGIEWLGDAYPKPHWVKVAEAARAGGGGGAAAGGGGGGNGNGGGGGGGGGA